MDMLQVMGIFIITLIIVLFIPAKANAHCDTMDGPTAIDGRKALEANNINYALKWISSDYEDELRRIFEKCVKVRLKCTHSIGHRF